MEGRHFWVLLFSANLWGCGEKVIELEDVNNFSYSGTIDLPMVTTASGQEIDICWPDLTEDIRCHGLDPATEINNVSLIRFPQFDETSLEERLADDNLQQADQAGYVELLTESGQTCAKLTDFSLFGSEVNMLEEFVDGSGLYMMMMSTGTEVGKGARMLTLLEPSADSSVTAVDVGSGCGTLDFTADLSSLTPVSLSAEGPWIVTWTSLTQTGLGNAISLGNIDGLMVAFYEGKSPSDLASSFFDLELIATSLYTITLSAGSGADLSEAKDASGASFGGFSGNGTWLLALTCSSCANPAPLFLTVVEPEQ